MRLFINQRPIDRTSHVAVDAFVCMPVFASGAVPLHANVIEAYRVAFERARRQVIQAERYLRELHTPSMN